jgi:hypothetical protein
MTSELRCRFTRTAWPMAMGHGANAWLAHPIHRPRFALSVEPTFTTRSFRKLSRSSVRAVPKVLLGALMLGESGLAQRSWPSTG